MRILLELPTWIGDSVMVTPTIEHIVQTFPDAKITLFGTKMSTDLFHTHPHVHAVMIDKSKAYKIRALWLYKKAKELGPFDMAFSFRGAWSAKMFIWFIQAEVKGTYRKDTKIQRHQVLRYNDFINGFLPHDMQKRGLKLHFTPTVYAKPTVGINPGASYGSAKRWYPHKFAEVAIALASKYNIVIFGGPNEVDIANDIAKILKEKNIHNYKNLAGKTTIQTLCEHIGGLSLFITGDSGPMHIATAYHVPTVALFGPTNALETSPWAHQKSKIVQKNMECAPCMKRVCPLGHHECMKFIESQDVLNAIADLLPHYLDT